MPCNQTAWSANLPIDFHRSCLANSVSSACNERMQVISETSNLSYNGEAIKRRVAENPGLRIRSPCHGLQIVLRIPITVKDDDAIRDSEIQA